MLFAFLFLNHESSFLSHQFSLYFLHKRFLTCCVSREVVTPSVPMTSDIWHPLPYTVFLYLITYRERSNFFTSDIGALMGADNWRKIKSDRLPSPPNSLGCLTLSYIKIPQNRAMKMNSISWEEFNSPKSLPSCHENQEVAQEGIIQKQIKLAMMFAHITRKPADS